MNVLFSTKPRTFEYNLYFRECPQKHNLRIYRSHMSSPHTPKAPRGKCRGRSIPIQEALDFISFIGLLMSQPTRAIPCSELTNPNVETKRKTLTRVT